MQPARYQSARNEVVAGVDEAFAEPVLFIARKGKGGTKDTDRFIGEIEAILRFDSGDDSSVTGGQGRDWLTKARMQHAKLHIDPVRYPTIVAEIGDEIRALSRLGEPYFEVLGVDRNSMTRLVLILGGSA